MAKRKLNSGTWIERELFRSKSFLSLRGFAPQLLVLILGKRDMQYISDRKGKKGHHQCVNCDRLTITYLELKQLGVTQPRATRARDELLAKGFVEIVNPGGAYQKDKTTFQVIDLWRLWVPGKVLKRAKGRFRSKLGKTN